MGIKEALCPGPMGRRQFLRAGLGALGLADILRLRQAALAATRPVSSSGLMGGRAIWSRCSRSSVLAIGDDFGSVVVDHAWPRSVELPSEVAGAHRRGSREGDER